MLRDGLDAAATASLKSAWFSALRDTAQTPETLQWLEKVWRQDRERAGAGARGARFHHPRRGARGPRASRRGRRFSTCSSRGRRIPIGRRDLPSCGRRCRPTRASATRSSTASRDVQNRRREPWVLEGLVVPPSPAPRLVVAQVHPAEPGAAPGDPAHRRHLFPQAVDGRDAVGPPIRERGADGAAVPRRPLPARLLRTGCGATILSSADDLVPRGDGDSGVPEGETFLVVPGLSGHAFIQSMLHKLLLAILAIAGVSDASRFNVPRLVAQARALEPRPPSPRRGRERPVKDARSRCC